MATLSSEAFPQEQTESPSRFDFQPPPFSETVDGPDYSNTLVSIEVSSSQRIRGKLMSFDVNAETIAVLESRKTEPLILELRSIKFLRLEKP